MERISKNSQLAVDLFPLIFRNLSIQDLFNCRLVNKQFKYFSNHTDGIYKLIIGQSKLRFDNYYWYYNNKLIEDQDIISLECFRAIKLLAIFNLDKYLKYLKIYDQKFKLDELSSLINLESLEFGRHYYRNNQQIINLNNLKIFVSSDNLSIKLGSSKLEKINFRNMNQIKLDSSPESIKHLITINYRNELVIFKNLEIIELRGTDRSINENLLIIFEYLKQLKIFVSYSNKEIKNSLIKILNNKMKLQREFDVYLEDVKIENIDKLNELNADCYPYWRFKLTNYDLLDLSFINELYYNQLEECVNNIKNDLPSTFFDKFQNICGVNVFSVDDVDGLNWFLNNLKYLIKLKINCKVSLDDVFCNNLPNTIKYLDIPNNDLNYDFILKLSKLIEFYTDVDKDLFDLAFTCFSNLKYLKVFRFYFKTKLISIRKKGKEFYLNETKLDYNQLVVEYNKIKMNNF